MGDNPISQTALIELALDLAQCLTSEDKFDRLLSTLRKTINCEAVALLVFKGEYLQPLAMQGLSKDTIGRRFIIAEHPRFQRICNNMAATRFPAHCELPDPYDGLLIDRDGDLPVHACMGIPLYFNDVLIGVLTMDSLIPGKFDDLPDRTLEVIGAMAAVSLNTALTLELLESNVRHSQQVVAEMSKHAGRAMEFELIGQSPVMEKLKREIQLVAPSSYSVLIQGESGTGKELVAHNIHDQSSRSQAPMIYVNCAALPENLIESELFGHVKGAFTGADSARAGKFQIADGGTLFLDEVGELPLAAQSKLLRALQSQEIQKVGQDKVIHVDVRVIAATNRDLAAEVDAGRFRSDLYHRLNVYPISVPALRDRQDDVVLLAGFFIERIKRKLGIQQLKVAESVQQMLTHYDWPGNVRELEHFLSRAALKASARMRSAMVTIQQHDSEQLMVDEMADEADISETPHLAPDSSINLRASVDEYQRSIIKKVLIQENGNWSAAAKRLQVDRANLNRLAKRLGIQLTKTIT